MDNEKKFHMLIINSSANLLITDKRQHVEPSIKTTPNNVSINASNRFEMNNINKSNLANNL